MERPTKVQSNNLWPLLIWRPQIRFLVWPIFGTSLSSFRSAYMIDDALARFSSFGVGSLEFYCCFSRLGGRGWALAVNPPCPPALPLGRLTSFPAPPGSVAYPRIKQQRDSLPNKHFELVVRLLFATCDFSSSAPVRLGLARFLPNSSCRIPSSLSPPTILPNDPLRSEQRKNLPPIHPRRARKRVQTSSQPRLESKQQQQHPTHAHTQ